MLRSRLCQLMAWPAVAAIPPPSQVQGLPPTHATERAATQKAASVRPRSRRDSSAPEEKTLGIREMGPFITLSNRFPGRPSGPSLRELSG